MLKECNHKLENDGIFWINIDDFVKNFKFVNLCKLNPAYKFTSISFKNERI